MTLKEALNFVGTGYKHILISDKNGKEYYYNDKYLFKESEEYKNLLSSNVTNVDADGCDDTVVFYLW